jgi:hypothetical protein
MTETAAVQFDDSLPAAEAGEAVAYDWPEAPDGGLQVEDPRNGYRDQEWPEYEWSQASTDTLAEVNRQWEDFKRLAIERRFDDDVLMSGVEKVYSTSQAAQFFGKSNQWLYWGLRKSIFTYKNGTPIQPERVGNMGKRRFTLPIISEIAKSCYRRGNLRYDDLHAIMAKILLAEFGEKAFANVEEENIEEPVS